MRFAYIDSQGKEVTIPSVDALRLRIELKAIVDDTMFHDANSGKWAPAREHGIFRTLKRELAELDAGGFGPPAVSEERDEAPGDSPSEPGSDPLDQTPAPGDQTSVSEDPPRAPTPGSPEPVDAAAGDAADPLAGELVDPLAHGAGDPLDSPADTAGSDDLDMGVTLDLVPEDDMEPEVGDLDESAAAGPAASALEGLEGMELAGGWGEEEELAGVSDPSPAGGAGAGDGSPVDGESDGGAEAVSSADGDIPAETGDPDGSEVREDAASPSGPPERFAMSPQDDLMESVPDPGLTSAHDDGAPGVGGFEGESAGGEDAPEPDFGSDLELEPGLAESFDSDALNAGTTPSDELQLESPLTDYDANQPPSWMEAQEPSDGGGDADGETVLADPLESAGGASDSFGESTSLEDGDHTFPPERGDPPARPAPRPRNAPPPRKLRRASRPGAGRLLGLLAAVAVIGVGGWYGVQAFLSSGGGSDPGVSLPDLSPELMPQMRQYAAASVGAMVESMAGLPERDAIPPRPDADWLAGNYLAGASGFESVPAYWNAVDTYVDAVQAEAGAAYRSALDEQLASTNLTADNQERVRERAVAGWEAAAQDREFVYDQLRAVAAAALDLHNFLVANEDRISYEPATAGVSRDPVLEAVADSDEIADAMWDQVGEVTRTLDNLDYLETVNTEGLTRTFLDKLRATPIQ